MSLYIIQEFDPDTMNWVNHDSYDSKDLAEVSIHIKRCTRTYSHLRIIKRVTPYWADGPMCAVPPGHGLEICKDLAIKEVKS